MIKNLNVEGEEALSLFFKGLFEILFEKSDTKDKDNTYSWKKNFKEKLLAKNGEEFQTELAKF